MRAILYTLAGSLGLGVVAWPGPATRPEPPTSAEWLQLLPDGPEKRQFILDCTGCHQFDEVRTMPGGVVRSEASWREAISRMLGFAGPATSFPVISEAQDPDGTARWLVQHLGDHRPTPAAGQAASPEVTEFLFPAAQDLPHDLAIGAGGRIVVTGMFSHQMYLLDPESRAWSPVPIPVPQANPRAIEIDGRGAWWVILGSPGLVARYESGTWKTFPIGFYAHSVALGRNGSVFANDHFTSDPEIIAEVRPDGTVKRHALPLHPELAAGPGGPIPYEIRTAPDGRVWLSELQGNRIVVLDPASGSSRAWELPTPHSGPRRFDIDARGVLWIPAYGAGVLVRFDPGTEQFQEIPLPVRDAAPYVVRVDDRRGTIWIGTGAANAAFAYHPASGRFTTYRLPSHGALVRHLAVDSLSGDVWLAYGESPGKLPARIARISPSSRPPTPR